MIDVLLTLGAVAESKALLGPDYRYELPANAAAQSASAIHSTERTWRLPKPRFDDARDCRTFLERQIEGLGLLRITHRCPEGTGKSNPWRSL